jgi:mono/diheme cytochrome c family protein
MRRAWIAVTLAGAACAQTAQVERGARLFRTHCATPYCHGPDGTAGRAPKLTGHSHTVNSMFKVISWGIPGTGMPEFTTRLSTEEIRDLAAWAMTLRAAPSTPGPARPPRELTPEAKEGRALFFDAGRPGAC